MIARPYSKRRHAMLSAALLIAGLIIIYLVIILPTVQIRNGFSDRMDDLQFQYAKFSHVEKQKGEITKELEQLQQVKTNMDGFLKDNSPALAAAELQEYVKNVVGSNEGSLISTQVVNKESKGPFPEVTVKVHLRCGIESLQAIIYQVESGDPVLLINNLYIQDRSRQNSRIIRGRNRQQQSEALLEIRFDVTGFIYQTETI